MGSGTFSDSSDRALKENIRDYSESGIAIINQLRPRKFDLKKPSKDSDASVLVPEIGFVAQEVEGLVPEIVGGEEGGKSLSYNRLTVPIIKAIQELSAKVEALENE